ncbi:hypothetical protein TRFO_16442 [Tritrichomonas foetus]|uniref:Uncharacterized protein n=1 Tax=Tritrichomonas foetus TaxID=1144522 RepID=A0A1J4KPX8_9EUKA|nr:hypothetical protein TRFO_16442 [Tritrichomonas foetus]|eukprot:OHT13361.1 hypothetical protein TRFO_16442 [Tritrichomonas foetus]
MNSCDASSPEMALEPYEYTFHINDQGALEVHRFIDKYPLVSISVPGKTPLCCTFSNKMYGPMLSIGYADGSVFVASDLTRKYDESCFLHSHTASVLGISYHHDENKVISVSLDGAFGIHTRRNLRDWESHFYDVTKIGLTSVLWNKDDIIVGDSDGQIRYFKPGNGKKDVKFGDIPNETRYACVFQTKIHQGYVRCMALLENSENADLVTTGDDFKIIFLKISEDKLQTVSEIKGKSFKVDQLIWDPPSQTLNIIYCDDADPSVWVSEEDGHWKQIQ